MDWWGWADYIPWLKKRPESWTDYLALAVPGYAVGREAFREYGEHLQPYVRKYAEEPWEALYTRPFQPGLSAWERWKRATPYGMIEGAINYPETVQQYREWQAPWGVKGAVGMANPLFWLPMALGPSLAGKGLAAGSRLAYRAGAGTAASRLAQAANIAQTTAAGVSALENLPSRALGAAYRGARRAITPARLPSTTMTTPRGLQVTAGAAGREIGRMTTPEMYGITGRAPGVKPGWPAWEAGRAVAPEAVGNWPYRQIRREGPELIDEFIHAREANKRTAFMNPTPKAELLNHDVYLLRNGQVGYAVREDSYFTMGFNNGPPGAGAEMVIDGLLHGGRKGDPFDGFLVEYYKKFGFKEVPGGRIPWDDQYVPRDPVTGEIRWDYDSYGRPDVVEVEFKGEANAAIIRARAEALGVQFPDRPQGAESIVRAYLGSSREPWRGVGAKAPRPTRGAMGPYLREPTTTATASLITPADIRFQTSYTGTGAGGAGAAGAAAAAAPGPTPVVPPTGRPYPGVPEYSMAGRPTGGLVNWDQLGGSRYVKPLRPLLELLQVEFPQDVLSRLAATSKRAKAVIQRIDPRRAASTDIQKLTTATRMSEYSGEVFSHLNKSIMDGYDPQNLFGFSAKDLTPKRVTPKPTWEGDFDIFSVYENPSFFNLTPDQEYYIRSVVWPMTDETLALRNAASLRTRLRWGNDEHYIPHHVEGATLQRNPLTGVTLPLAKGETAFPGWEITTELDFSRMANKPRFHQTTVEGAEKGVLYSTPEESIRASMAEAYREATLKELNETVEAMARRAGYKLTPLERMPQALRQQTEELGRTISGYKYIERQVRDAVANKRLSGATLAAIERRDPEIAARLHEILNAPMPDVERAVRGISSATWEGIQMTTGEFARAAKGAVAAGEAILREVPKKTKLTPEAFLAAVKEARGERLTAILQKARKVGPLSREFTAQMEKMGPALADLEGPITRRDIRSAMTKLNLGQAEQVKLLAALEERMGSWRLEAAADISLGALRSIRAMEKGSQAELFALLKEAQRSRKAELRALVDETLERLTVAKEAMVPLKREYLAEVLVAGQPHAWETAWQGKVYPKELGLPLKAVYKDTTSSTLRAMEKGVAALRMGQSGFDLGVETLHLLPTMFYDARAWAKSSKHMIAGLIDRNDLNKYLKAPENVELAQELAESGIGVGGVPAEFVEAAAKGGVIYRVPGVGRVASHFESSFTSALTVAKVELWRALRQKAMVNGMVDPQLKARYMAFIRNVTGTLETRMLGIPANQRAVENVMIFYASRYTRAGFALIDDAIRGRVTRTESIRALASLAAASTGIYMAAAYALGQEPQLDPRHPGRFMTIQVGNTRIGVGGFHSALLRFLIGAVAQPGDIVKLDDWQDSEIARFFRGRTAIPTGVAWDFLSRQTYMGEPLEDYGDIAKHEVLARTLPFWASDYITQQPRPGIEEFPAQFLGLRAFAVSYYETRDNLREEYAQRDYGKGWNDINKLEQQKLVDAYSDLAEATEMAEIRTAMTGGLDQKAWRQYKLETEWIDQYMAGELAKLAAGYRARQYTGDQFRRAVDEVYSQGRAMRDQLEGDDRFSSVFTWFSDPNKDVSGLRLEDMAYGDYCAQLFADDLVDEYGRYNYERAEERKAAIRAKYGDAVYQYIQERLAYGDDVSAEVQQLQRAKQILRPYWAIEDKYWQMRPGLKAINARIKWLESYDPDQAKALLAQYPMIVRIREMIAKGKKRLRNMSPDIEFALRFYR